jgi:hypothetical protein
VFRKSIKSFLKALTLYRYFIINKLPSGIVLILVDFGEALLFLARLPGPQVKPAQVGTIS